MNPRWVWAVAQADFRERMRRAPVWMTMLAAVFLCYLAVVDKAGVTMEGSRGVWNTAWCAGTMAVLATCFLSLVCFFVIRNSVLRDEETGAGKLVATARISNVAYLSGKFLSNFAVLLVISLVFVCGAPVLQWSRHAGYPFRTWQLINPFLYITLPAAAFVSAMAVLFECHAWLKKGVGNVVYVFAWIEMLREAAMESRGWTDMVGFYGFINSCIAAAAAQGMAIRDRGINIGHAVFDHWTIFTWNGFSFSWHEVILRAEWFLVAGGLLLVATAFFKRFDPDVRAALRIPLPAFLKRKTDSQPLSGKWDVERLHLTSLQGRVFSNRFFGVVRAELRLLLTSVPKFVYVVLGIANLIALMPSGKEGPGGVGVLGLLWIAPVVVWSHMGSREQAPQAAPLIFSTPHSMLRQLPAEWLAGVLLALGVSAGVGIRDLVFRDFSHLGTWLSGAMFIASLAIACGTWSRSSRLFQALYTGWWYLALSNAPNLDFTGITGQRHSFGFTVLSLGMLASAMLHRWWATERATMPSFFLQRGRPKEKAVAA